MAVQGLADRVHVWNEVACGDAWFIPRTPELHHDAVRLDTLAWTGTRDTVGVWDDPPSFDGSHTRFDRVRAAGRGPGSAILGGR